MDTDLSPIPKVLRVVVTMNTTPNPFNITKAVDFSDQEIHDYWVDISGEDGFVGMTKPTSPMPMLILGGKGSGKTHLMRHFSYPLQRIQHADNVIEGIRSDGYLGIYFRCGGLNSHRFSGKGQPDETWVEVFAYYMELLFGQLVLDTVMDLCGESEELKNRESALCTDICALFDMVEPTSLVSLANVCEHLNDLRRRLDKAVNNCAITGSLDLRIPVSNGRLIFGMPRVFSKHLPMLEETLYVYLIDEFENLTESQQKYINTLYREKEKPCSFKIGARLYGVRTYSTYSADEDNKEGSEYDKLWVDSRLRLTNTRVYRTFAKKLILKRLVEHGFVPSMKGSQKSMAQLLDTFFENPSSSDLAREETAYILDKYEGRERPHFQSLRMKLETGLESGVSPGVTEPRQLVEIVKTLQYPHVPLLEKANAFLLYKDWNSQKNLVQAAKNIASECHAYAQGCRKGRYARNIHHFKADLLAQLSRECDQKQRYRGIDTIIDMSWGLPKNLLILLKDIFSWAVFYGEQPFREKAISTRAQDAGVAEAAEWFFRDARMTGRNGRRIQDAINRLGTLFRSIRFSDKPAECSCSAFSCDVSRITEESRKLLDLAEKWSLLIDVGDQSDRNTERVDLKYQMNRMLAPRWGIAISRRGVLALSPDEVNAVFDPDYADQFDSILKKRIDRMTAPYFGPKPSGSSENFLPGFDSD